jgi:prepilin-type N-terminal cleavage/methylation domain-containing protein
MSKTIRKSKKSGFTLIELLIVIGLLAALAAVLLPTLMGDRESALSSIDKYNAAGTLRTLRQYQAFTEGQLPNGMHTGLESTGSLMTGVTEAYRNNAEDTIDQLEAGDVEALAKIGITKLAYGKGNASSSDPNISLGYKVLAEDDYVVTVDATWKDEDGSYITFNGKGVAALLDSSTGGYAKIINLFLTPTADWSAEGTGWVKGFNVKMDVPGTCPLVEDEFGYYTVFIGIRHSTATCEVTVKSDDEGDPVVAVNLTTDKTATIKELQDAIDSDYTTAGSAWSVETGDEWSGVEDGATQTFTHAKGTVTYRIKFNDEGTAELLGTSCPEHGVTNP